MKAPGNFWRQPPSVRAAITCGDRKSPEWHKRIRAEAQAAQRAEFERRNLAA